MRISISNLAWDREEDEQIAVLLNSRGINAIDIAPGKYFPDPPAATSDDILAIRQWWLERGIEVVGMQALLFGTTGLNVFGPADVQDKMLAHLRAICKIGNKIGARKLTFGSPKNRDCSGVPAEQSMDMATSFFLRLGDIAESEGVWICLEPNPIRYGANFMTNSTETAVVVRAVSHPAIKMQLDTGAMAINGEDPEATLSTCGELIGHVHLSEPDLVPLGDGGVEHESYSAAIKKELPEYIATIEMLATKEEPHSISVERAIGVARQYYE